MADQVGITNAEDSKMDGEGGARGENAVLHLRALEATSIMRKRGIVPIFPPAARMHW